MINFECIICEHKESSPKIKFEEIKIGVMLHVKCENCGFEHSKYLSNNTDKHVE